MVVLMVERWHSVADQDVTNIVSSVGLRSRSFAVSASGGCDMAPATGLVCASFVHLQVE